MFVFLTHFQDFYWLISLFLPLSLLFCFKSKSYSGHAVRYSIKHTVENQKNWQNEDWETPRGASCFQHSSPSSVLCNCRSTFPECSTPSHLWAPPPRRLSLTLLSLTALQRTTAPAQWKRACQTAESPSALHSAVPSTPDCKSYPFTVISVLKSNVQIHPSPPLAYSVP